MKLRRVEPQDHYKLVNILKTHGMSKELAEAEATSFPMLGFVSEDEGHVVAAGFLRMVEGGFAQFDNLMTNTGFTGELRHEAINMVVDELLSRSRRMGLKGVIAHTQDKSVLERAKARGFITIPQSIIALPLTKDTP